MTYLSYLADTSKQKKQSDIKKSKKYHSKVLEPRQGLETKI